MYSFAYFPEAHKVKSTWMCWTQKAQRTGWVICKSGIRDASDKGGHKGMAEVGIKYTALKSHKNSLWLTSRSGFICISHQLWERKVATYINKCRGTVTNYHPIKSKWYYSKRKRSKGRLDLQKYRTDVTYHDFFFSFLLLENVVCWLVLAQTSDHLCHPILISLDPFLFKAYPPHSSLKASMFMQ